MDKQDTRANSKLSKTAKREKQKDKAIKKTEIRLIKEDIKKINKN